MPGDWKQNHLPKDFTLPGTTQALNKWCWIIKYKEYIVSFSGKYRFEACAQHCWETQAADFPEEVRFVWPLRKAATRKEAIKADQCVPLDREEAFYSWRIKVVAIIPSHSNRNPWLWPWRSWNMPSQMERKRQMHGLLESTEPSEMTKHNNGRRTKRLERALQLCSREPSSPLMLIWNSLS